MNEGAPSLRLLQGRVRNCQQHRPLRYLICARHRLLISGAQPREWVPHSSRSLRRACPELAEGVGAIPHAAPILTPPEDPVVQAESYPPLPKNRKDGAPTVLVASAKIKSLGHPSKPNGRVLVPGPGTYAFGRDGIRSHSCVNPFTNSSPYCSGGCITGKPEDIQRLNNLIDSEPGSSVYSTD
jgi:hypothetical protein